MTTDKISQDGTSPNQGTRLSTNGVDDAGSAAPSNGAPPIRLAGVSQSSTMLNRLDSLPARRPGISLNDPGQNASMHVGKGVKLAGKVSSCGTLTIEGSVEAKVTVKTLQIAKDASFEGAAIAEDADIDGRFDGTLHVSGKLVVRRGARVTGRLSYGQMEVETGAEIRGQVGVQFGTHGKKVSSPLAGMRAAWRFGRG